MPHWLINYNCNYGVQFKFTYAYDYVKNIGIDNPLNVSDNINNSKIKSPFDKVWVFHSDEEINALVNSYLFNIRQQYIINHDTISCIEWSINETLDNVLQHSDAGYGYIMGQIHKTSQKLNFCIFDTGIGIFNSLRKSPTHHPETPIDAITLALQEKVTRDTNIGQGNGLWGLSNIVRQAKGSLLVSSGGATYFNNNNEEQIIKYGDFNLGKHNGTTTINFQFDYSQKISMSKALSQPDYQYVDLWLENLESEDSDNIFSVNVLEMANGTGTRKSAQKLRNIILNLSQDNTKTILIDFKDVCVISSSFADELIGMILKKIGFVRFNKYFRIVNANHNIEAIINRSVGQRMAQSFRDR